MPRRHKKSNYRKKQPIKRMTVSKVKKIIHKEEIKAQESLKAQAMYVITPQQAAFRQNWFMMLDFPLGNTNAGGQNSKYFQTSYNPFDPSTPAAISDTRAYSNLMQGNKIYRHAMKAVLTCTGQYWTGAGPGALTRHLGFPVQDVVLTGDTQGKVAVPGCNPSFNKCQIRVSLLRSKKATNDTILLNYLKSLPIDNNPGFFQPFNNTNLVVMSDRYYNMNATQAALRIRLPIKRKAQRISKTFQTDKDGKVSSYWIDRGNIVLSVMVYTYDFTVAGTDWHFIPDFNLSVTEWFRD